MSMPPPPPSSPRPGMIGPLPRVVWRMVADTLSSPEGVPDRERRATLCMLRGVSRAMRVVVADDCVGGAKWPAIRSVQAAARLAAAPTAGLGRAVVVGVWMPRTVGEHVAVVEAAAEAVRRGHMLQYWACRRSQCDPAVARTAEAVLAEASRRGLLLYADLVRGEASGWSADAMAQLSVVMLVEPKRATVASMVAAGSLQRLGLKWSKWADLTILATLREVELNGCNAVEDLAPLARVHKLVVDWCLGIRALPAMRNNVLEVTSCQSLADLSGLAGGSVRHLALRRMPRIEDVRAIGAMSPPPRKVTLEMLRAVRDVSALAGVCQLKLIKCFALDKATTEAVLKGRVGTLWWE